MKKRTHLSILVGGIFNEHITYGVRKDDVSYKCELNPPKHLLYYYALIAKADEVSPKHLLYYALNAKADMRGAICN